MRDYVHPAGPTPIGLSDIGQTLGKDRSWTGRHSTSKSTHGDPDDDGATMAGRIVKRSPIATAHRSRSGSTLRTSPISNTGAGANDEPVTLNLVALNH